MRYKFLKDNKLPEKFAVIKDDSGLVKNTLIEYISGNVEKYNRCTLVVDNELNYCYIEEKEENYLNYTVTKNPFDGGRKILSLKEFIILAQTPSNWQPKRGDKVLYGDSPENMMEGFYLTSVEGASHPHIILNKFYEREFSKGQPFNTLSWKYILPLSFKPKRKMTISDIEEALGESIEIINNER